MLQKICAEERDGHRSQLEIPGINLGTGSQENLREMRREPLQNMNEPSAVSRQIPWTEEDLGPGNTETEAPESMRNSRPERISCTNKRVGLLNMSWDEATDEPAG